jgi:signal transduction histidine kinase/ligand-binding sensor domain-containing protein
MKRRCVRFAPSFALLIVSASSLFALDPTLSTTQYLHAKWTQEEGIGLPAVQALAQTSYGYLWLGTSSGLIRFDGIRFVPWESISGEKLASNDIRYLAASSEGGLWIGTAAGVSRLDRGRLTSYPSADRWLGGVVSAMLEDHLDRLWVIGAQTKPGIALLSRDGSTRVYGLADGLPNQKVRSLFEDSHRNLWIGTDGNLCRWSPGSPAVCLTVPRLDVSFMVEGAGGDLLILDRASKGILRLSNGKLAPLATQLRNTSLAPKGMMRDHDGNVWIGTVGQGLLRLRAGRLERFRRRDGLSSDLTKTLLEDHEGNLWVGTVNGIDRFRDPKVLHLSTRDGLSSDLITAVYTARHGAMWVGTSGGGLNRVVGGQITHYLMNSGLPGTTVLSIYEDGEGRLWAGTTAGLAYLSEDKFVEVRTPDRVRLDRVFAITGDDNGVIWLADSRRGLLAVRHGAAQTVTVPGLQTKDIYQLQLDRSGVLWIGYYQGGITAIKGSSATTYNARDGLAGGPVQAIEQDRSGAIWVGTGGGLSRFRNGVWTTWSAQHGMPEGGVYGIIEDDYGALWLITSNGILRLPLATLNESPDASPRHLNLSLYGQSVGLPLASVTSMANPRGAKSEDGRLWICTEDGVAIVDPRRLRGNPVPPPVVIEQMLVDGRPLDAISSSETAFQGRQLQIAYTGLSLMAPERVRFRYRLDGLDRNWTEAGTRRNVVYVNLPPRRYRFRVIACNNDDVWNTQGAVLAFRVQAYFYQTWWFVGLCVSVPAFLAWGVHRLRVRRLVSRFQLIAQERARFTRELHDSLLQGFAGVVYQLEAAARQFESAPETSKQRLERAIDQADQSLQEARRTILSMRLPALESSTLPEALSAIAARLTGGTSILFHLEVKGRVRHLPYDAQANMYLIGREAITNSVNHAQATRILAGLAYSEKELRLMVQDDGVGFDPATAMAKKDHWGMAGMQERATQIGATLTVNTSPGRGTKIEVVVPRKG